MTEERANLSLPLNLEPPSSPSEEKNVHLRRDSHSLRRARERSKERTPTMVVSDAFTFLNENHISIVDAIEDGCLRADGSVQNKSPRGEHDVEKQKDMMNNFDLTKEESSVGVVDGSFSNSYSNEESLLQSECHFLKDSGFASLERHLQNDEPLSAVSDEVGMSISTNNASSSLDSLSKQEEMDLAKEEASCQKSETELVVNSQSQSSSSKDFDSNQNSDGNCLNSNKDVVDVILQDSSTDNQISVIDRDKEEVISSVSDTHHVMCDGHKEGDTDYEAVQNCDKTVRDNSVQNEKVTLNGGIVNGSNSSEEQAEKFDDDCRNKSGETINISCTSSVVKDEGMTQHSRREEDSSENLNNFGSEDVVLRRSVVVGVVSEPVESVTDGGNSFHPPPGNGLLLETNPATEVASDDSSDEDTGIYAESFRRSNWVRVSQDKRTDLRQTDNNSPIPSRSSGYSSVGAAVDDAGLANTEQDEVFSGLSSRPMFHARSDSVTTTASESEFQTRYMSRRKCLIQRAESQQEYHRLSARVYEDEKEVVVERSLDDEDLGLHLLDSHPAYITSVDAGSPADKAGIVEGQILVTVNESNVLMMDHLDIITMIQKLKGPITFGVASSDFQPIRDLQAPVKCGFIYKLGNSSLVKTWKRRYFILRHDNCLYYYKTEQDADPLGALPLGGYTISRHTDTSKDFCFKTEKYRARTYYFMTDNRDQLTEWVAALTEAAVRSKKQKESSSFMSVSSHNVSLPALDIRCPDCSGYLLKMSPHSRTWRRRYCLLKDACIYYYKDVNAFSALGVAHLHGYKVDGEGHPKKRNSFSIRPPDPKMREFCFAADNSTDKKRWVESIIHSIQRWVPATD